MIDITCSHCRYSRPTISDDPDQGPILKCNRYPAVLLVLFDEVTQVQPDADEACGEWTPRIQ